MPQYYSKPVTELVKARRSVRTYDGGSLEPELRGKLLDYIASLEGLGERPVRFAIIDKKAGGEGARVGTYGLIRGARQFIAAVTVEGDEAALLELGYRLEKLVLYATSLGLGTVWLGGTFRKGLFGAAAGLKEGEILPIVAPVGHTARPGLIERMMRKTAGSSMRMDWKDLFFDGESLLPLSAESAGGYRAALEAVRLAPSAMNAQPWRIVRVGGSYLFFKAASHTGSGADMHVIDMGIALCHFELAAREEGLEGSWAFNQPAAAAVPENFKFIAAWQPA